MPVVDETNFNGGFLFKKQYEAMEENGLEMKLLMERCIECST